MQSKCSQTKKNMPLHCKNSKNPHFMKSGSNNFE